MLAEDERSPTLYTMASPEEGVPSLMAAEAAAEAVPQLASASPMPEIPGIQAMIAQRNAQRGGNGAATPSSAANREGRLSDAHCAALVTEYGEDSVGAIEPVARTIFDQLDTERDGRLTLPEFAKALGQLGATSAAEDRRGLASFMFSALDVDDSGGISFDEFVHWKLTMLFGSPQNMLRLGFNICDLNGDGTINRIEVASLLASVFSVLSGLNLGQQ